MLLSGLYFACSGESRHKEGQVQPSLLGAVVFQWVRVESVAGGRERRGMVGSSFFLQDSGSH